MKIRELRIIPTSMVTHGDLQRIVIQYRSNKAMQLFLTVYKDNKAIFKDIAVKLNSGLAQSDIMLPVPNESFEAVWEFFDKPAPNRRWMPLRRPKGRTPRRPRNTTTACISDPAGRL